MGSPREGEGFREQEGTAPASESRRVSSSGPKTSPSEKSSRLSVPGGPCCCCPGGPWVRTWGRGAYVGVEGEGLGAQVHVAVCGWGWAQ